MMSVSSLFSDERTPIYIIAEIGVNHNGSLERAMQCIDAAVACGANAVKFQTFKSEKLVTQQAQKADYQNKNTASTESQLDMLKKLELRFEDFVTLKDYCAEKSIDFMSTPFDDESAEFLDSIKVDAFKIGSGDMNNIPFLQKINQYRRPVLLSTGMSELDEIREPLTALENCPVILLHCTSDYPAPLEDVNLRAIRTMAYTYGKIIGYSDHTEGIEVTVAAVALGARVIEKHFTLDRNLPGPDHKASLEPKQFAALVKAVRGIEQALGDGVKRCMPSEKNTKAVARKSLVLTVDKHAGDILTEADISVKRPGTGIEPKFYSQFIGKTLTRNLKQDQMLTWEDIQ
ncbi:N-acetylneuraminate synthase [Paenibacillus sp. Z6-24]